jgi:hypothetical protein
MVGPAGGILNLFILLIRLIVVVVGTKLVFQNTGNSLGPQSALDFSDG